MSFAVNGLHRLLGKWHTGNSSLGGTVARLFGVFCSASCNGKEYFDGMQNPGMAFVYYTCACPLRQQTGALVSCL